jgi:predicted metal-dependent HD superfamily phosphohydrolase
MQNFSLPYSILYKIIKKYSENNLSYHNWGHIQEMFMIADSLGIKLSQSQELAILFHDVVYKAGAKDNEEKSAYFMRKELEDTGIPESVIEQAEQIILDTATHQPSIPESKVVLDLDMAHLSFDFNIFLYYRDKIKEEYPYISDEDFYQGEISFFDNVLKQDKILFTNHFSEEQLRYNLKQKILMNKEELKKTAMEA